MKKICLLCPYCEKDSDLPVTYLKFVPEGVLEVTCPNCSTKFNIVFEFNIEGDKNDCTT
jgi:sarcosine oxidase delta subunit